MNQPKRKVLSDFPELMLDWKQELNPEMNPNIINYSSHKRVNWCCHKCGRIWPLSVKARTIDRVGCTCDAMQRKSASLRKTLVKKKGSLRDHYPEISKLWNYEKNGDKSPQDYRPYSKDIVWWICYKGHEWPARINSRTQGRGCKECNKEKGTSFPEQAIFFYLRQIRQYPSDGAFRPFTVLTRRDTFADQLFDDAICSPPVEIELIYSANYCRFFGMEIKDAVHCSVTVDATVPRLTFFKMLVNAPFYVFAEG